jgi:hypothetical protein
MAKKKRKHRVQAKLSLNDRLAKYWRNQDWTGFLDLYNKERTITDIGPWAKHLEDGLYNALTKSIVEAVSPTGIENLAKMLLKEAKGPEAEVLKKCAQVALGLTAKTREPDFPSGKEIAKLPEPYSSLGQKLLEFKPSRSSKPSSPVEQTLSKIKKQFLKLSQAKSISPFKSFVTYTSDLNKLLENKPGTDIASAISNIALLLHQIKSRSSKGSNFGEITSVYWHPAFQALKPLPPHFFLVSLWNLFCSIGQNLYGDDWFNQARLLVLHFMPDLDRDLASHFQRFLTLEKDEKDDYDDDDDDEDDFLKDFFKRTFGVKEKDDDDDNGVDKIESPVRVLNFLLTEKDLLDQEQYLIHAFLLHEYEHEDFFYSDQTFLDKTLSSFSTLTTIGSKWRHGFSAWSPKIMNLFELFVTKQFTQKNINFLPKINLPLAQFSKPLMLAILFLCPLYSPAYVEEKRGSKNFSPLTEADISQIVNILINQRSDDFLNWLNMDHYLTQADIASVFEAWVLSLIGNSVEYNIANRRPGFPLDLFKEFGLPGLSFKARWQDRFSNRTLEFGHHVGLKPGVVKAFLELLVTVQRYRSPQVLTFDEKKLNNFYLELPNAPDLFAVQLLFLVISWPSISNDFMGKLAEEAIKKLIKTDNFDYFAKAIIAMDDDSPKVELAGLFLNRLFRLERKVRKTDPIPSIISLLEHLTN